MPAKRQRADASRSGQAASLWPQLGIAAVLALVSALLFNLGMPGLGGYSSWWPLLFFCLIPLLFDSRLRPWPAAAGGFLFGLAAYSVQLHWILIVLGHYGGLPLWLSLPALLLLAAYMALYSALFCLLLAWLGSTLAADSHPGRYTAIRIWMPPLLWVGLDALRGLLFTGFPWMDLGYGLFRQPQLLTAADLGGHHLISFSLVLINAVFAFFLSTTRRRGPLWRSALPCLVPACLLLVGLSLYSLLRGVETRREMAAAPQAAIGVVQGNIAQEAKWSEAMKEATVERYLRLSRSLADRRLDLVAWPETALPFYPQDDPLAGRVAAFAAHAPQSPRLLTGAPLYRIEEHRDGRLVHSYNGALLFGPQGQVDGVYNKQHLVPFGEYVPALFRRLLSFVEPVAASGDFSAGTSKAPLAGGDLRLGVLVCYESIFPAIARDSTALGANLLVNITNDAWYGRSSAPVQSLAMATLRAVENRRALVRSANTGISGFIDPMGKISGETALFTEAAAAGELPLLESRSFFTRAGHHFGLLCALLSLPLLLLRLLRRPDTSSKAAASPTAKKAGRS